MLLHQADAFFGVLRGCGGHSQRKGCYIVDNEAVLRSKYTKHPICFSAVKR
jgi:hypothetical protein